MTVSDLTPGQGVKLDIKTKDHKGSFDTKVAMVHKNIALLDVISVNGKPVGFSPEFNISLTITAQNTFYVWNNVSIQTVSFKGKYYHAVELTTEATTQNRRNNFRVFFGEPMTVVYFSANGPKHIYPIIKDISETGFAFITKESFDLNRMVRLNLTIQGPGKIVLPLSAKIVRIAEGEHRGETLYGCRFAEKNQKLSNYLMQQQRDRQKKKMFTKNRQ